MDLSPIDLSLGVVDLFAVLLPGGLLMALLAYAGERRLLPRLRAIADDKARWLAFLLAAYVLGHFVGLASPRLLAVYSHGYRPVFGKSVESYQARAEALAATSLGTGYRQGDDVQLWAQTVVRLKSTVAAASLDRIEADVKFFRSMVLVSVLALLLFLWRRHWRASALCLAFGLLCLAQFFDLQINRETKTLQYFIALSIPSVSKTATESK